MTANNDLMSLFMKAGPTWLQSRVVTGNNCRAAITSTCENVFELYEINRTICNRSNFIHG